MGRNERAIIPFGKIEKQCEPSQQQDVKGKREKISLREGVGGAGEVASFLEWF